MYRPEYVLTEEGAQALADMLEEAEINSITLKPEVVAAIAEHEARRSEMNAEQIAAQILELRKAKRNG